MRPFGINYIVLKMVFKTETFANFILRIYRLNILFFHNLCVYIYIYIYIYTYVCVCVLIDSCIFLYISNWEMFSVIGVCFGVIVGQ